MAAMGFATSLRNARAQAIRDAIDAHATNPGTITFYTAPRPATSGGSITTQTVLGTCTFAKPCGTVSNGVLTFYTLADDNLADATGVAAWCRILDGGANFVADLDVTDANGAGPVKMPSTQVYQNGIIHFASATITEGNV